MNTALFTLRCLQIGLSIDDLDKIEYGFAIDMMLESGNDGYEYKEIASQSDFDKW